MSSKKNTSIVWFKNNLRVEDNSALYNAVNQSDRVIGYVNIDPNNFKYTQFGFKKTEKYRAKFLLIDDSKWMTGQIIPFDGGMSSVKTN